MTKTDAFFLLILHVSFYGVVLTGCAYVLCVLLERLAVRLADRTPPVTVRSAPRQGSVGDCPSLDVERSAAPIAAGGALLPPLFPDVAESSTAAVSLPDTPPGFVGSRRPVVLDPTVAGMTSRCDVPDQAVRGRAQGSGSSAGMSDRPPHVFVRKMGR